MSQHHRCRRIPSAGRSGRPARLQEFSYRGARHAAAGQRDHLLCRDGLAQGRARLTAISKASKMKGGRWFGPSIIPAIVTCFACETLIARKIDHLPNLEAYASPQRVGIDRDDIRLPVQITVEPVGDRGEAVAGGDSIAW